MSNRSPIITSWGSVLIWILAFGLILGAGFLKLAKINEIRPASASQTKGLVSLFLRSTRVKNSTGYRKYQPVFLVKSHLIGAEDNFKIHLKKFLSCQQIFSHKFELPCGNYCDDRFNGKREGCGINDYGSYKKLRWRGSMRRTLALNSPISNLNPLLLHNLLQPDASFHRLSTTSHEYGLPLNEVRLFLDILQSSDSNTYPANCDNKQQECAANSEVIIAVFRNSDIRKFADRYWRIWFFLTYPVFGSIAFAGAALLARGNRRIGWSFILCGVGVVLLNHVSAFFGCNPWNLWRCLHDGQNHSQSEHFHGITVTQKLLTFDNYCITVIGMANVLDTDKQITVIGALAEGSSIRSIERITGVHRDTIMRLGVKVGKGCAALMDAKMRDLPCRYLEFDEIWGFIGKKEKHVTVDDSPELGDVWTFCAVDAETKIVPTFRCGKRDRATANAFVQDVASRMKNRVQISTDGLRAYVEAVEKSFGADVDYAQIVKTYTHDVEMNPNHRYSAPEIVTTEKKIFSGSPDISRISTSYVERLNGTTRTHMRRLTRLTLAFSKKLENFEAAVGLHFAYYNFVKRHNTLRCTPAMAAGIEQSFLTVGDLVEAAA